MDFSSELIHWYHHNKRELPWRKTRNPYHIWLSEIILQQTRVAQGMEYYLRFVKNYPTVQDLAAADQDQVLKLWQGLGYYSRARNLHATAKEITNIYSGVFPKNYQKIRALKGIGDYTAAAIASFAFHLPHAVVDGNVYRVLARVFDIDTPIDSTKGKKEFALLAEELLQKNNPAEYNQAIMEFGALQCQPQNPACKSCCLRLMCESARKNNVTERPVKTKSTKQRKRYFNYLLIEQGLYTFIKQREKGDIWQGLFEFPLIETDFDLTETELTETLTWKAFFGTFAPHIKSVSQQYKHILSHQVLYARFWSITISKSNLPGINNEYLKIKKNEINNYAIPRLIDKVLNSPL